jgi:hypothetical protein
VAELSSVDKAIDRAERKALMREVRTFRRYRRTSRIGRIRRYLTVRNLSTTNGKADLLTAGVPDAERITGSSHGAE